MKLELSLVVHGCWVGVLTGLGRTALPGGVCCMYTRCCTMPQLTHDTLHTLNNLPSVTQLTLDTLVMHAVMLRFTFTGLHDTVLYCSLHDPVTSGPPGHIINKTVSVWGSGGRIKLTVAKFVALQKAVQPDLYQSMADRDTWQSNPSRKRVRKSVDRTLAYLGDCLILHNKTQVCLGLMLVRLVRETAKRPVGGFSLDGLHTAAMEKHLQIQLITAIKELPEDKPRLLHGLGRPDEALACVEVEVDLFERFFPFQVTERGCALSFPFNITTDPESAGAGVEPNAGVGETTGTDNPQENQSKMTPFKINLKDERYRDDFSPLVEGCGCYHCRNHKKACLLHLLVTNELLAGVLLMLHNMAHYCAFFTALRGVLASNRLGLLKKRVLQELGRR
uniref:Queuine tRNA-ribosyltransferase accessory subunit 2 n=1 Tax=Salmo trutta TaxID=8032 RepID=A0A673YRR3_SALTR